TFIKSDRHIGFHGRFTYQGGLDTKKIWKMRKNKEAVSPVIATILMVAITVVLAAVLYVMVMGFGTTNGSTPTATMTYAKASGSGNNDNYTFVVAGVTRNDVKWSDVASVVVVAGGDTAPAYAVTMPNTGFVGAGDVVTITGLDATKSTSFTLKYTPTGGAVYQLTWTPS
ncbi:MAG TPA: type IV pilin N-terminal domain-containing protein, partial [Methanomassiliicoccales archaeon]|nr:type IV pilin N-terminal domain-containing protein [Methanomassiliicoccales archaeon]